METMKTVQAGDVALHGLSELCLAPNIKFEMDGIALMDL